MDHPKPSKAHKLLYGKSNFGFNSVSLTAEVLHRHNWLSEVSPNSYYEKVRAFITAM